MGRRWGEQGGDRDSVENLHVDVCDCPGDGDEDDGGDECEK